MLAYWTSLNFFLLSSVFFHSHSFFAGSVMSCALSFNYCQLVWFMSSLILLERSEITIILSSLEVQEVCCFLLFFFLKPALRQNQMRNMKLAVLVSLQEMLFFFFFSLLFDRPGKEHRAWNSLWCSCRAEMILNKCTASGLFFFFLYVFFFLYFLKGISINNYFYKAHFSLQSFFITVINFFVFVF